MSVMTTAPDGEAGRRRRLPLWARLTVVGGLIALAAGLTVVVAVRSLQPPAPDPVSDRRGLTQVRQRLSAAAGDLDAVPDPVNAHARRGARLTGCSVDSGEVFEPGLFREWRLVGPARSPDALDVTEQGRRAGSAIAAALISRGWSGTSRLDQDAATGLTRSYDGYTIGLTVQAFSDSVLVSGHTRHRRVCRRSVS